MNIIAVDDERLALKSIIDILINLKEHPEVKGFQSASEAIEFAKSNKVDVAFLDVEMASINGIEPVSYTHLDVYKRQQMPSRPL